jgi:hypothetical protein
MTDPLLNRVNSKFAQYLVRAVDTHLGDVNAHSEAKGIVLELLRFILELWMLFRTLEGRDRDVILVRHTVSSGKPRGVGNLERGGNGEGMGRGRSV